MENKSSKEYVSELLKQLEELKKKKARKERKLQKLKGSAEINLQKDQASRNVSTSCNKTPDEDRNIEKSIDLIDLRKNNNYPYKVENSHFCNGSKCTKTVNIDVKNDKENCSCVKVDSSYVDEYRCRKNIVKTESGNSKVSEDVYNGSDRDSPVQTVNSNVYIVEKNSVCKYFDEKSCDTFTNSCLKSDFSDVKRDKENFFCGKHDTVFFDDCIIHSDNIEKSNVEVDKPKFSGSILNFPESTGNIEAISCMKVMSVDVKVSSVSATKDFPLDNSYDDCKEPNCSNKSLPNSQNKISDILDDSLNSNMSCFLSSDLFPVVNDKKEINENKFSVSHTFKNAKQNETDAELIPSDSKISSPIIPALVSHKIEQHNFNGFNFPKFSTPTAGIAFLSNSDKSMQNSSLNPSSVSDMIKIVSNSTGHVYGMDMTYKNDIQPQEEFDQSKINLILGRESSSVLDFHYEGPEEPIMLKSQISSSITLEKKRSYSQKITGDTTLKKRRVFSDSTSVDCLDQQPELSDKIRSNNSFHGSLANADEKIVFDDIDFDNTDAFPLYCGSFGVLPNNPAEIVSSVANSSDDISSQVTQTINGLVTKVCENSLSTKCLIDAKIDENMKMDYEILVIPETEGLGLYFSKDTDNFLKTSTLSGNLKDFNVQEDSLNMSSQARLESPAVNEIMLDVKPIKGSLVSNSERDIQFNEEKSTSAFYNLLSMDTSFLEDNTQVLGDYKQVPYINKKNIKKIHRSDDCKIESNLNFICSLYGSPKETVIDVEIVMFSSVKYAFIQHKTQIHVWCQEKEKEWIKIFNHQVEDMLSLVKICVTMDDDNLVVVMLLSSDEQYCLQFLLFEKDMKVIKLMENTHWLEERHSEDSVLLCGLDGLMFGSAEVKKGHEVSLHAFISLKDSPRLMTTVLGSTDSMLYSLCKINKLPNALMGINDSMLYVWHILEARLVTAVSLHPHDYLPIKQCFWSTVENGLIYLLTTCEGKDKYQVCQLLAANLATGFCQSAMTYSSQPSRSKVAKITKAVYMEPFLVLSHLGGALLWSVMEEHCCAALSSKSDVTSVAISRDFENWGLIVVGSKLGYINCYGLN